MFKSTFSKYFSLFSAVLIIGVVLLGTAQAFIFYRFWSQETEASLTETATHISAISAAAVTETPGEYRLPGAVAKYIEGMTRLTDCNVLIADRDGEVLLHVALHRETEVAGRLPSEMLSVLEADGGQDCVSFAPAATRLLHEDIPQRAADQSFR